MSLRALRRNRDARRAGSAHPLPPLRLTAPHSPLHHSVADPRHIEPDGQVHRKPGHGGGVIHRGYCIRSVGAGFRARVRRGDSPDRDPATSTRWRYSSLLLRPAEAAVAIGVSRSRLYQLLASGELPSVRLGRTVRVPVAALQAWIAEHLKKDAAAV